MNRVMDEEEIFPQTLGEKINGFGKKNEETKSF